MSDYEDEIRAAVDLVRRTGARGLDLGYLDGILPGRVHWYAHAQYAGTRITVENHRGPVEALEALARRMLTGARCTHCGGLIALTEHGAIAYPGAMLDGTTWTEEQLRAAPQCHYHRVGARWVRGCEAPRHPTPKRRRKRGRPTRGSRRRH